MNNTVNLEAQKENMTSYSIDRNLNNMDTYLGRLRHYYQIFNPM